MGIETIGNEGAEPVASQLETGTGRTEAGLAWSGSITEIIDTINSTVEDGYMDGEHFYSKEEIISAVELAEEEGTAEIPTLYKVPGLQAAVAQALEK